MTRICPVCGLDNWEHFLTINSDSVLTSDQRIVPGRLSKIICTKCGVVANAGSLSPSELQVLYGENYQLNTGGQEEHLFYSADGPIPRSQVIYDWIVRRLPDGVLSLLEIGCGEGNVLQRFAASGIKVTGIEGSRQASELARSKGLKIINELITSPEQTVPHADVVMSYGVLEHVEDIDTFVSVTRSAVNPDGVLVFGLPVQDHGGYDHFFLEHVWHFTVGHVCALLHRRNCFPTHVDASHPINGGFGLFVCDPHVSGTLTDPDPKNWRAIQIDKRDHWLRIFERVNSKVAELPGKRLAVYGSGEVLSLLLAYTELGKANVVMCIDEDPAKIGTSKHGIPVRDPGGLTESDVDGVVLTVNPRYEDQIRAKLAPVGLPVLSLIS